MRIAVVEDEARVAARLLRLLRECLGAELEWLRHVETLEAALALVQEEPLDLLFLDLNLYGQDGFRLLQQSVAGSFHTVVVSAHQERAVEAFEHGVLDFIPKPYSRQRLEKALGRARDATSRLDPGARVLAVRKRGRLELIATADIAVLRGAGDYVEIVTTSGEVHLHDKTLDRLEQILPPTFQRVHRSFLLDLGRLRRLLAHSGGRYEAILEDGTTVPVSRSRIADLRRRLEDGVSEPE